MLRLIGSRLAIRLGLGWLALLTIAAHGQSSNLDSQIEQPHEWYWLGHWHLWHGGWAYWWTVPILFIAVGAAMFYLGRWSVRRSTRSPTGP